MTDSPTPDSVEDQQPLVSVGRFLEPTAANMARSALEEAGIDCLLRGANANSLLPFAFEAELQVRASDQAAAEAILADAIDSPPSEAEVLSAEESERALEEHSPALPGESTED